MYTEDMRAMIFVESRDCMVVVSVDDDQQTFIQVVKNAPRRRGSLLRSVCRDRQTSTLPSQQEQGERNEQHQGRGQPEQLSILLAQKKTRVKFIVHAVSFARTWLNHLLQIGVTAVEAERQPLSS